MQNKLDLINLMNVRISNFGKNKLMQKELEPVRKEKETKIAIDLNNLLQVRIKGLEKYKHLNNLRKQRLENIKRLGKERIEKENWHKESEKKSHTKKMKHSNFVVY